MKEGFPEKRDASKNLLTEEQKEFIRKNSQKMYKAELAKELGVPFHRVTSFCKREGIVPITAREKGFYQSSGYRNIQSESVKKLWENPEYRKAQEKSLRWKEERKRSTSDKLRGKKLDRSPAKGFYVDGRGYKYLTGQHHHPLARRSGEVQEHRVVLYDKIGPGPHNCYWECGRVLDWVWPEGITVDHLDSDPTNNKPENLAPSCRFCNSSRRSRREFDAGEKRPI